MASYAAVISLTHTIEHLSDSHHISVVRNSSPEIITFAYEELLALKEILLLLDDRISIGKVYSIARSVKALEAFKSHLSNQFHSEYQIIQFADTHLSPLQKFLQDSIISKGVNVLDRQLIREALRKLEDVIEPLASKFRKSLLVPIDMEEHINSFAEMVMNIKEYSREEQLAEEDDAVSREFRKLDHLLTGFQVFADKALEEILQRLKRYRSSSSRERLNALEGQIREAACKLEDALEAHLSNQFLLQSDQSHPSSISVDLQEVNQDIDSFTQFVKKLKEEYISELFNPLPEDDNDDDDDDVSSKNDFGRKKSKMVGFSDDFSKITDQLTGWASELEIIALIGMPGIGKTTFAKEVFEDSSTLELFDLRVWVDVGPSNQIKEIMQGILAKVKPDIDKMLMEEEKLAEFLYESLKGRRYFIVLDDVWDNNICYYLKQKLPNDDGGSRVLLTTRLGRIEFLSWISAHKMRFLNKEESWDLLRGKVFGEESCPPQLEKAGKKIAETCEGLPLTIVTVANLLCKVEKTPEYWNKIAENENSVFMDAYDEMSKVLLPSYNYLPQRSKACFLYMGVFPQNYEIPISKLFNLWVAEGYLGPHMVKTSTFDFNHILEDLVASSLLMVRRKNSTYRVKICTLHSSFWHLSKGEARKNNFFHVVNSRTDGLVEGVKSQRRLCIHKNVLFSIKDVYDSMESISNVRSLLCTGPHHQYPVPVCFGLRLLKVLDTITIRFYEFPLELLKLVHLRYLAFTYDGKIPASISKLWNLQFLIVHPYVSVKSSKAPSYLPVEIWDMKELKYLQIMGSNLPEPCGAILPNLLTLLDVSPHSCTKGVLEGLPNLMKLGIQIELAPDVDEALSCFDHISYLYALESLKCVVVNPEIRHEVVAPPAPLSIFPSLLKKLSLSGFGYLWEDTHIFASLPSLEELKLRCYAFRGQKWETEDVGFLGLKVLTIEDTDLVHWTVGRGSFRSLRCLSLKHCYKLEQIPREFCYFLSEIELVDCNPLAVACAKQMGKQSHVLNVNIHSS